MHAELAGVRAAEIELEIRGRELILAGHRRPPTPTRSASTSSSRSSTGRSGASIALGADVVADAAKATYQDGILTVELPLAAPAARAGCRSSGADGERVIEIATPGAGGEEVEMGAPPELPDALPVLPLRDTVTFPDTLTPLAVGQERSIQLVNDVLGGNRMLVMVASRDPEIESPGPEQLYDVGVVGAVARMLKVPDGTLRILVQAGPRVRLDGVRDRAALPRRARRRAARRRRARARS